MEMRGMSGELLGTIGQGGPAGDSRSTDVKQQTLDAANATGSSTPNAIPAIPAIPASPPLPSAFISKKRKILSGLHPPDETYTDKSPKGSVDAQIIDLIDEINAHDGLVTTSSCAGRVSVFLEGVKIKDKYDDADDRDKLTIKTVPGGKGLGGRWLFVSHEPLEVATKEGTWSAMFGLEPYVPRSDTDMPMKQTNMPRLVKFAFEPLILHVLCADLRHAAPLLAAAVNAGFRESGVQSLKVLDEKEGEGPGVMVGIRTAGLGVESIVGVYDGGAEEKEHGQAIVSEECLDLLVRISGERFQANEERRKRFKRELREHMRRFQDHHSEAHEWEDKDARAQRKRKEGLQRKEELRREEAHEQLSTVTLPSKEVEEDLYQV